jgi:hypothetical protein
VFSCGLNNRQLRFIGPKNCQEDFLTMFRRLIVLTGDVFFLARPQEVDKDIRKMLARRSIFPSTEDIMVPSLELLQTYLPPAAAVAFRKYSEFRSKSSDPHGTWLADVQQTPMVGRAQSGPFWPTQLTHGTIISWLHGRQATALEHLACQGFHLWPSCGAEFESPLRAMFDTLPNTVLKSLSGNGMHLAAWGAWCMYMLANTVRVDNQLDIGMYICPTSKAPMKLGSFAQEVGATATEDAEKDKV